MLVHVCFETFGSTPELLEGERRDVTQSSPLGALPTLAGRRAAGRRARRSPPGGDDARGEGGPAGQPLDRSRASRRRRCGEHRAGTRRGGGGSPAAQRRPHGGRLPQGGFAITGGCRTARARPSHEDLRQHSRVCAGGRGRADPAAEGGRRGVPVPHSGDRPRGVPHRLHGLRRHGVPGSHRVGRHVRPRPRRAHGGGDRPRHGRARHPPGALTRPRRRPRLPLGARRGDHRRGPVPRDDPRCGVRARAAERRP